MDQYLNLARRYRPQKFSEVVGQETIVTIICNALRFNRVANAYLLTGSKGTGKTSLARLFAKALNCLNPEGYEPCLKCDSCQQIQNHASLDVIEIDGASNRGIDDIRQINETCRYTAALGRYKIYIIDEVHMLTKEAFNALLKTLEEPPQHVKFFFATTEAHKVLPTILSRCQRFDLSRIPNKKIVEKLKKISTDLKISVDEDAYQLIAQMSLGSLRDAESLFDQMLCLNPTQITRSLIEQTLGLFSIEQFFHFDEALIHQNYPAAFQFAEKIFQSGIEPSYFLEVFLQHIRNILVTILNIESSKEFLTSSQLEHYQKIKEKFSQNYTFYLFQTIMKQLQSQNRIHSQTHLELFLLHLIEAKNRVTLQEVMEEIEKLEKRSPEEKPSLSLPNRPIQQTENPPKEPLPVQPAADFDTLIQFAKVELQGTIKKS